MKTYTVTRKIKDPRKGQDGLVSFRVAAPSGAAAARAANEAQHQANQAFEKAVAQKIGRKRAAKLLEGPLVLQPAAFRQQLRKWGLR